MREGQKAKKIKTERGREERRESCRERGIYRTVSFAPKDIKQKSHGACFRGQSPVARPGQADRERDRETALQIALLQSGLRRCQ